MTLPLRRQRDGALGDEELSGDLSVCASVRGNPRDLFLLWSELVERIRGALAGLLAGGQQLLRRLSCAFR
jgi:hypothetical protein